MLCCRFREKVLSILSTFLFRTPMALHMVNTKHLPYCLISSLVQKEDSNARKARTGEACGSKTNPHGYSVRNLLFESSIDRLKSLVHETLMRSAVIGVLYFVFEDLWTTLNQDSITPSTTIRMEKRAAILIHQEQTQMLLFMDTVSALSLSPSCLSKSNNDGGRW